MLCKRAVADMGKAWLKSECEFLIQLYIKKLTDIKIMTRIITKKGGVK